MRPDGPRDPITGPDSGPEAPFPIKLSGPVIKGFGRGSKELGIPTANIPPSGLSAYPSLDSGIYYGYVGLLLPSPSVPASNTTTTTATTKPTTDPSQAQPKTYPAVLSIGYNPFYANTTRSIEIHILSHFASDFYGAALNLLILGYIRPEYDYVSKESLIDDIRFDCDVARKSLAREAYAGYEHVKTPEGKWLREFAWADGVDVERVEREVLNRPKDDGDAEGEGAAAVVVQDEDGK